ncbi:MAG: monooxygenase, partial [Pelagibaca sp.]|nr:monooxygenase [Pelagibaca sp.]
MGLDGRQIIVAGGGIGGLAAALALRQRGAEVRVLEQAGAITEVGAGIQVSPNGLRVIEALGLGEALRARACRGRAVRLRDYRDGAEVTRLDLDRLPSSQGYYFVHRADLIALLADAAREAGVTIRLLQKVAGVRP